MWTQLLDDYVEAVNSHDTMKFAIYFSRILNGQVDMGRMGSKIDFNLVNKRIKCSITNAGSPYSDSDYYQQLFLASADLCKVPDLASDEGVKTQIATMNLLSKRLLDDPSLYLTPIIVLVRHLHKIVCSIDTPYPNGHSSQIGINTYIDALQRPFKMLLSNKSDHKVNVSAVHIFAIHLFSAYFTHNTVNAAINLYKVLQSTLLRESTSSHFDYPPLLPTSEPLFNFYLARAALAQGHHSQAYALLIRNKHMTKNLALKTLYYLLPLEFLQTGKTPTLGLFHKYQPLQILAPLYLAIKRRSLSEYNALLPKYEPLLLQTRVLSLYREMATQMSLLIVKDAFNLFNSPLPPSNHISSSTNTSSSTNKSSTNKSSTNESSSTNTSSSTATSVVTASLGKHIVPFHYLAKALSLQENECESLLCILVASQKIKGYLSHSQKCMVLSKSNPFPAISGQVAASQR